MIALWALTALYLVDRGTYWLLERRRWVAEYDKLHAIVHDHQKMLVLQVEKHNQNTTQWDEQLRKRDTQIDELIKQRDYWQQAYQKSQEPHPATLMVPLKVTN